MQSLLVTDIVGSTRLWAEHESSMARDLVVHDEVVVGVIEAAGGRVFKHTGDGVMATFEDAAASAVAAAQIQRHLAVREWRVPGGVRVRVGLHSGSVHERGGDLFGPPVNRLARLLSRCPPDAVLVSEATAALLVDGMPAGLGLRELGRVELKDVGRQEVVSCLEGEGLAAVDAAEVVGTMVARGGPLPPVDTELVGRSSELSGVVDALSAHALVSLVGVGGMGKTRLAVEAATVVATSSAVWWCDLTAATVPEEVPVTVLAALGGHQTGGRSPVEEIVDRLASGGALVVFDNCEHVVDAARELIGSIRAGAGDTRLLVTSREALGVRGELVVSLSSLPGDDSVGLFCARAVEARPDLALDPATLAVIGELCVRLDGIPLALELAAARCRSMAPSEILARLDDRFRLLRGGRGGVERHRTLLATVEWSYGQLDDDERRVFDRMAVFVGGALIDAISQVCDVDEYDALDVLDRLVARSMVVAMDTPLGTRYRQLETLRQYAEDRLIEAREIDVVRDRHLHWAANPRHPYAEVGGSADEAASIRRCAAEVDNLRAAVRHAVQSGRVRRGCDVLVAMGMWSTMIPVFETIDWLDVESVPTEDWDRQVAQVAAAQAVAAMFAGRVEETRRLLEAIPEPFSGDPVVLLARSNGAQFVDVDLDLVDSLLERCRPATVAETSYRDIAFSQSLQGHAWLDHAGDVVYLDHARIQLDDIVATARRAGAGCFLSVTLTSLGYFLAAIGDHVGAIQAHTESSQIAKAMGAGLIVDVAAQGVLQSSSLVADVGGADAADVAVGLRAALAETSERHNVFWTLTNLASGVETLLWAVGDLRTSALIGSYARANMTNWMPTHHEIDSAFAPNELAAIEAEAARLDLDAAVSIAIDALDRIIAVA